MDVLIVLLVSAVHAALESLNNSAEDADKKFVSTQCKASGTKKYRITWHNEGEPVSREDILNTTGNLITVTSKLIHTTSSLPDKHGCNITYDLPLGADPEKAAQSIKEPTWESVNRESLNNSAEDADKKFVSKQCKASGTKKFWITWHNEGEPVSREDITNTTGNLITVTSTLTYTASSLPANHRCNITQDLPPGADPEKAAHSMKEPTWGSVNRESANNSEEDADKKFVSTQCKASGTKKFWITWQNEGEPVSREDTTNTTGNLITVTSTLTYTASSLPANHRCSITHEINEEQQSFWIRQAIIITAGALFLLISILLCYKACKRTEAKTPQKPSKAENGQITPMSSTKNISTVTKCTDSPNFLMENDYGKVTSSLSMNERTPRKEGTPFNRKNPGESAGSSIKKRTKPNRLSKKADMNNIDDVRARRALLFKE